MAMCRIKLFAFLHLFVSLSLVNLSSVPWFHLNKKKLSKVVFPFHYIIFNTQRSLHQPKSPRGIWKKKIGESFYRSLTLYTEVTHKNWNEELWHGEKERKSRRRREKSWITIRQILNIGIETINYWINIKHVDDSNFCIELYTFWMLESWYSM